MSSRRGKDGGSGAVCNRQPRVQRMTTAQLLATAVDAYKPVVIRSCTVAHRGPVAQFAAHVFNKAGGSASMWCDVRLVHAGLRRPIGVHSLVLCGHSEHLRQRIETALGKWPNSTIDMRLRNAHVHGGSLQPLVAFMYSGELSLSCDALPPLYATAAALRLRHALDAMHSYMFAVCNTYKGNNDNEQRDYTPLVLCANALVSTPYDVVPSVVHEQVYGAMSQCMCQLPVARLCSGALVQLLSRHDLPINEATVFRIIVDWLCDNPRDAVNCRRALTTRIRCDLMNTDDRKAAMDYMRAKGVQPWPLLEKKMRRSRARTFSDINCAIVSVAEADAVRQGQGGTAASAKAPPPSMVQSDTAAAVHRWAPAPRVHRHRLPQAKPFAHIPCTAIQSPVSPADSAPYVDSVGRTPHSIYELAHYDDLPMRAESMALMPLCADHADVVSMRTQADATESSVGVRSAFSCDRVNERFWALDDKSLYDLSKVPELPMRADDGSNIDVPAKPKVCVRRRFRVGREYSPDEIRELQQYKALPPAVSGEQLAQQQRSHTDSETPEQWQRWYKYCNDRNGDDEECEF